MLFRIEIYGHGECVRFTCADCGVWETALLAEDDRVAQAVRLMIAHEHVYGD